MVIRMGKIIANRTLALLLSVVLAIASASALTPVRAVQASPSAPLTSSTGRNAVLAREIVQLFNEDQALLADLEKTKQDPAFRQTLQSYVDRSKVKDHNPNFYDSVVYALWARTPDAPEIVRRYAMFRKSTDARVQSIVAEMAGRRGPPWVMKPRRISSFSSDTPMATTSGE
jgi:hypothetical protein